MFSINYAILEEERNRLLGISNIEEFEADLNTVVGQFQLIFNKTEEGFVDKDIPYDGEFLIAWFTLLNDVLIQLKTRPFVAMNEPASDIWLEIDLKNEEVAVSKIKEEEEMDVNDFIVNIPKRRSKFFWCERISKDELYKTVLDSTRNFIKDVLSINELLSDSRDLKNLEDTYMKAKEVY